MRRLPLSFFRRPAAAVARDLLGRVLVRQFEGERLALRIVETEAYVGAHDRACHAWRGRRTARNESMYRAGGVAYVYFVYGMHHCLNVVTGARDAGEAVLLRAGEPLAGEATMRRLRGLGEGSAVPPGQVAGGPARLCQALAVDRGFDGCDLRADELCILGGEAVAPRAFARGPRVGVAYAGAAAAWRFRFALRGNPHVSKPWPW